MQTTVVLHAFTNLVNVQVNRRPLDSHLCECTSLYSAWCDTTGHIAPRTFPMCSGKNESKKRKSCYYCSEKPCLLHRYRARVLGAQRVPKGHTLRTIVLITGRICQSFP